MLWFGCATVTSLKFVCLSNSSMPLQVWVEIKAAFKYWWSFRAPNAEWIPEHWPSYQNRISAKCCRARWIRAKLKCYTGFYNAMGCWSWLQVTFWYVSVSMAMVHSQGVNDVMKLRKDKQPLKRLTSTRSKSVRYKTEDQSGVVTKTHQDKREGISDRLSSWRYNYRQIKFM